MESQRYDIIGDLHGCVPTLRRLCDTLGYDSAYVHPDGRILGFVGDLADRGPDSVGALRLVMDLVENGHAWNVLGNHDHGLLSYLTGDYSEIEKGLRKTVAEIDEQPVAADLKTHLMRFLGNTPLVLRLAGGRLILAHAGIEQTMLDKPMDSAAHFFILNGDAIGKSPEGKTLRRDWAASYTGSAFIVYGHTPQETPLLYPNSANIDTGAYRGRALTALRWPEIEIVSQAVED